MLIIRKTAFARAGVMGNPSDGYHGKTLSIAVRDYSGAGEDSVFSVIPSHRPASTVSIYDKKGSPVRTLDFTSGPAFSRIAYDGTHLVATWNDHPLQPFLSVLKADGDPVGLLEIEALRGDQEANPRPFIVNPAILA